MVEIKAVRERILEAVARELRGVVVGNWIDVVIVNFFEFNAVSFEQFYDVVGFFDEFGRQGFGGLLFHCVAVQNVDAVLESRGCDVVEKAGEGLFFVLREMPDNESDGDGMVEAGIKSVDAEELGVDGAVRDADVFLGLKLLSIDIFVEPVRIVWA